MTIQLGPGQERLLDVQLTPIEPTVVSFQPSKDAWIDAGNPNTNYGYAGEMYIGWTGSAAAGRRARALLQFPIRWGSDIPSGATIVDAQVDLGIFSKAGGRQTLNIQRLLRRDWGEGAATWEVYKSGSPWGSPGAGSSTSDYTTVDAYGANVDPGDTRIFFGWHWRLRNQVQWAQANNSDVAFRIYDTFEDPGVFVVVGTKDHSMQSTIPRLYVKYL